VSIGKHITFFGRPCFVSCDANCDKAWGINARPRVELSADEDDFAFRADDELGVAPVDPGTYEGEHGKPTLRPMTGEAMNKWCVRECERSSFQDQSPKDFSQRVNNKPSA
jgi:hypothetical protein